MTDNTYDRLHSLIDRARDLANHWERVARDKGGVETCVGAYAEGCADSLHMMAGELSEIAYESDPDIIP